ncbi:MAG TPA: peptidoglycan DD-metalloendopeptidase family protein [Candidatus Saccharimonadales bacterium]|nr:peptidoglycan DD-metalloendopeptidase family protein [Candidatus Saccharimonadales bacterium]
MQRRLGNAPRPASSLATLTLLLGLAASALPALGAPGPMPPAGFGEGRLQPAACTGPEGVPGLAPGAERGPGAERAPRGPARVEGSSQVQFPSYAWPLDRTLDNGLVLVNYIDHDPSPAILDYDSGAWSYDGHTGTDITLYDFREMDRGVRILAAAPGVVNQVVYPNFDRNIAAVNPNANFIDVDNGDGSHTYYYHLRRNSAVVNAGDAIAPGEFLGYAGSSGYSTLAHLHFEVASFPGGNYTVRDPWNGPDNPVSSLWQSQLPYAGQQHLHLLDLGATTQAGMGGNPGIFNYQLFAERLSQPLTFGLTEPILMIWLELHGLTGDSYTLEVHRADGSLFGNVTYSLSANAQQNWHYWYWWLNGFVTPADAGNWYARVLIGGTEVRRINFGVAATTTFGPRLQPAGRSLRFNGSVQYDTLRVSPFSDAVTFSLAGNAPGFVSLQDSILTIPGVSPLSTRSVFFQAVARDGAGRQDSMWYHLVDPSKPLDTSVGAPDPAPGAPLALAVAGPNPFRGQTRLRFTLAAGGPAALDVYDPSGRRVRRLAGGALAAGEHTAAWDGRDNSGARLPSGVYFCRLEAGGRQLVRKLVRM